MPNIIDILARALSLRQETALNSITPNRAGGIMYDTLLVLNQMQLEGASLLISKVYDSVSAMEADTTPTSDLTGRALKPGQLVVIVTSDSSSSDMGSEYRYNSPGSWTYVGKVGGLPFDTVPTEGSSNGITSGAVYQLQQEVTTDISHLESELDGSTGDVTRVTEFVDTGKFLFDNTVLESSNYNITDYIDIEGAEEIVMTDVWATQEGVLAYVIYDSSKNKIASNPLPSSNGEQDYDLRTLPSGAKYIRCSQNYLSNSSVEVRYGTVIGLVSRVTTLENAVPLLSGLVDGLGESLQETDNNVASLEDRVEDLEGDVNGSTGSTTTIVNFTDTGKFLYGTGTLDSSNYNITGYIDIEGAVTIDLTNVWASTNGILSYVIYDAARNILVTSPTPTSDGEKNYHLTSFPAGAKYIRCTQNYLSSSRIDIVLQGTPGLKDRVSNLESMTESLDGRVSDLEDSQVILDVQDSTDVDNLIKDFTTYPHTHFNTANGQELENSLFTASAFIEISANSKYTCGRKDPLYGGYEEQTMQEVCFYNGNKVFLSSSSSVETITTPANAKFLRFSVLSKEYDPNIGVDDISELEIVAGENPVSVFSKRIFGDVMPLNGLKGKKWLVIGDSNTEHNFRANGKYDDFIAAYTGVKPTNIGKSGAGFRVYENTDFVYLNILNDFHTQNPSYVPDFITIMGGTNDVNFDGSNIGEYTDTTTASVFGYMYLLVQRIKEVYPNVPFAICTQFPQNYGDASKQTLLTSFVQGEMDFCKYRNIPCLDLFFCSGLRPEESGFNAHYYSCSSSPNGDGIHLNYYGQKLISARIREFLMSFFGEL